MKGGDWVMDWGRQGEECRSSNMGLRRCGSDESTSSMLMRIVSCATISRATISEPSTLRLPSRSPTHRPALLASIRHPPNCPSCSTLATPALMASSILPPAVPFLCMYVPSTCSREYYHPHPTQIVHRYLISSTTSTSSCDYSSGYSWGQRWRMLVRARQQLCRVAAEGQLFSTSCDLQYSRYCCTSEGSWLCRCARQVELGECEQSKDQEGVRTELKVHSCWGDSKCRFSISLCSGTRLKSSLSAMSVYLHRYCSRGAISRGSRARSSHSTAATRQYTPASRASSARSSRAIRCSLTPATPHPATITLTILSYTAPSPFPSPLPLLCSKWSTRMRQRCPQQMPTVAQHPTGTQRSSGSPYTTVHRASAWLDDGSSRRVSMRWWRCWRGQGCSLRACSTGAKGRWGGGVRAAWDCGKSSSYSTVGGRREGYTCLRKKGQCRGWVSVSCRSWIYWRALRANIGSISGRLYHKYSNISWRLPPNSCLNVLRSMVWTSA